MKVDKSKAPPRSKDDSLYDEQTLTVEEMKKLVGGGTDEHVIDMDEIAEDGAKLPDDLDIVPREEWGARPPLKVDPKPHLTTTVMFTYSTEGKPCFDKEKCSKRSRNLQNRFMSVGFPDIPFNFMVGGDGRVYEGRGWYALPETNKKYIKLRGFLIEIAFIGDYIFERPPEQMYDAALDLIQYGRVHFKIRDRFGLIENYEQP